MHGPREGFEDEVDDGDRWTQPGTTLALMLSTIVWVIWWAASMVVAPIRLAIRRQDVGMMDEVWRPGDRR